MTQENPFWYKETFAEKLTDDVSRVFKYGDVPANPWQHFKETLQRRPIPERELLRAMLTTVRNALPKDLIIKHEGDLFDKAPFETGEDREKSLKRIGSGAVNTVFLLEGSEGIKSQAVGIRRRGFKRSRDALEYATCQQEEYERIKKRFSEVGGLIPNESRIVYERHDGKAGVMFFRDFIEGPIRDVFELQQNELEHLLATNERFANQVIGFVSVSMENIDAVCSERLDILGINNLVVAGPPGNEEFILLEPHNCERRIENDGTDQRVADRLRYLSDVVNQFYHS